MNFICICINQYAYVEGGALENILIPLILLPNLNIYDLLKEGKY